MVWEPITGLGADWQDLAVKELPRLVNVWFEQRESLADTESLKQFNERLAREWAIETGILERLYTLDRGVTQLLIERGIDESLIPHDSTDRPPAQVAAHIHDQKEAVDWLFEVTKTERPFSESFIKHLHALITRSQKTVTGVNMFGRRVESPLLHGTYKKWPNNPTRAGAFMSTALPSRSRSRWNVCQVLRSLHPRRGSAGGCRSLAAPPLHADPSLPRRQRTGCTGAWVTCLHEGGLVSPGRFGPRRMG